MVEEHTKCILRTSYYQLLMELLFSHFSHVRLFVTPWTIAHQAPLSMRFPRQEYGSGLPFPSPGDLPEPWIEPAFCVGRWIIQH